MQDRIRHFVARNEKFEKEKLKNVNQRPHLEGDSLEFLWDIADAGPDTYQIIGLGDFKLCRELAYFDDIPRFHEVKEFLKNRYETRFKSLRPTEGSLDRLSYT
jgi:hypothetical protein